MISGVHYRQIRDGDESQEADGVGVCRDQQDSSNGQEEGHGVHKKTTVTNKSEAKLVKNEMMSSCSYCTDINLEFQAFTSAKYNFIKIENETFVCVSQAFTSKLAFVFIINQILQLSISEM